ncbi:hypothetical protein pb186bvf_007785 [Paramecium bursaria]
MIFQFNSWKIFQQFILWFILYLLQIFIINQKPFFFNICKNQNVSFSNIYTHKFSYPKTIIKNNMFQQIRQLEEGSTSIVYLIEVDGKEKILKQFKNDYPAQRIQHEINILKQLEHPNIVRMEGYDENSIVFERLQNDDLFNMLRDRRNLKIETRLYIFSQVCHAVKYIHDKNIAHRDIKPENILLTLGSYQIKLADFGASEIVRNNSYCVTKRGTLGYQAPELIFNDSIESQKIFKCDIFALGVLFFVLIFKRYPFEMDHHATECPKWKSLNLTDWNAFWELHPSTKQASPQLKSLFQNLLNPNPDLRFTIDELISQEFFNIDFDEAEYIKDIQEHH